MTYRRKGHAEHDNQCYVPAGEIDRWAAENDPLDRYASALTGSVRSAPMSSPPIDARVTRGGRPRPPTKPKRRRARGARRAVGVYADPPAAGALVREGVDRGGRARAPGRAGVPTMAEVDLSRGHSRRAVRGDGARPGASSAWARTSARYGGAFKVTEGLLGEVRRATASSTRRFPRRRSSAPRPAPRTWACGRSARCSSSTSSPARYGMLTNYVATARYRAFLPCPMVVRGPERRVRAGRPVPLAEPRSRLPAHARTQDRLPGDCQRRQGPHQVRHPRRRLRALLRAQVSLPPDQGGDARGRSRRARSARPGWRAKGTDLSIITYAATVWKALEAAEQLENRTACRSRCSTCGRCCRWTTTPSSRR